MLARIIKITTNKTVIQNEDGEIYNVQKTELDFKYKLGDKIEIIQNGDEYYFLPINEDNLLTSKTTQPKQRDIKTKHTTNIWLSFFIITAILGGLYTVIQISSFKNIDSSTCSFIGITTSTCKELNNIIDFERLFGFILSIWQITSAIVLIKTTKHAAITNIYWLLAARIVVNLIDILWANNTFPASLQTASTYQAGLINDAIVIGYSVIWLLYFANSSQIKETFTEQYEPF